MKKNIFILIMCSAILLLSSCHFFNQTQSIWVLDSINGKIEVEKLENEDPYYEVDILVRAYPDEGYKVEGIYAFDASYNSHLSCSQITEKGENVYGIFETKDVPVITVSAIFTKKQ